MAGSRCLSLQPARRAARSRASAEPQRSSRNLHVTRSTVADRTVAPARESLSSPRNSPEGRVAPLPIAPERTAAGGRSNAEDACVSSITPRASNPRREDEGASPAAPVTNEPWGLQFSGSLRGLLFLNLGAALFGSNQVIIKTTEELLSPVALDALRFGAAAVCFAPFLPSALRKPALLMPSLELGLWLTAGYTCQAFGLEMTSASHGAFTGTFTVLAVPLLVGLSGRAVARRTWGAAAAALVGVSLLTTSGGNPNLGDLICIMAAVLFGVHIWRSEVIASRVDDANGLVALQLAILAGISTLLCVPELSETVAELGVQGTAEAALKLPWPELLFMGVGTTAFTLWIEMEVLVEVSSPLAALIYTAEPLWGAGFAWVLLDERWGAQGWVGAALIIGASLVAQLGGDVAEHVHRQVDDANKADI